MRAPILVDPVRGEYTLTVRQWLALRSVTEVGYRHIDQDDAIQLLFLGLVIRGDDGWEATDAAFRLIGQDELSEK